MSAWAVRISRLPPRPYERAYGVPAIPGVEIIGLPNAEDPRPGGGQWQRAQPVIGTWALVDPKAVDYWGMPLRGLWMLHAEYSLRELREWLDAHAEEVRQTIADRYPV